MWDSRYYFSLDATCEVCPSGADCSEDGNATQWSLPLKRNVWRIDNTSVEVRYNQFSLRHHLNTIYVWCVENIIEDRQSGTIDI